MFCDKIKLAVAAILSEYEGGVQRACGSCNPSCDDLTRFICFGHTMSEVEDWIDKNNDVLSVKLQEKEAKLDQEYAVYAQEKIEADRLNYSKSFCKECPKYLEAKTAALRDCESIFDAVFDVETFQRDCLKTCEKFNEAFIIHSKEVLTCDNDFSN